MGRPKLPNAKSHTREYQIWCAMKQRCYNKNNISYHNYGGRGIRVCRRWKHNFDAFLADMGPRPDRATIERKDNNGPYSPQNCIWTTRQINNRNRRNNFLITIDGVTKCATDWCSERGLTLGGLHNRINCGMSPEQALSRPSDGRIRKDNHILTAGGVSKRITDWARQVGIAAGTIRYRMRVLGMTQEQAIFHPRDERQVRR